MDSNVTVTRTRRSIATQLTDHWKATGLTWTVTSNERDGIRYHVDGRVLTPVQAADHYLPGGFAGSFGRA